jgi:uroporphyrinogen-III synthase
MRSIAHKIRTGMTLREALEAAGVTPPYIPDLGDEDGDELLLDEEVDDEDAA